jgi:hypothetical protein
MGNKIFGGIFLRMVIFIVWTVGMGNSATTKKSQPSPNEIAGILGFSNF